MSEIRMSEKCKHGWIDTNCYYCLKEETRAEIAIFELERKQVAEDWMKERLRGDELEKKLQVAVELFEKYSAHLGSCDEEGLCDCGYYDALEKIKSAGEQSK